MNPTGSHPFSDLSAEQVQSLIRAANDERARVIRGMLAALFSGRREAQVCPPRNAPALSHTVYY